MALFDVPRMAHYRTLAAGKIADQLGADQIAAIRIDGKKVDDPARARDAYRANRQDDPNKIARWIDTRADQLSDRAQEYLDKFAQGHFQKSIERTSKRRSVQAFLELMEIKGGVTFEGTAEITLKDGTTRTEKVSVLDVEATLDIIRDMMIGTLPGIVPGLPLVGTITSALTTIGAAAAALYSTVTGDKPKARALWHMTKRQAEATAVGNIMLQAISMGALGSIEEGRRRVRQSHRVAEFRP